MVRGAVAKGSVVSNAAVFNRSPKNSATAGSESGGDDSARGGAAAGPMPAVGCWAAGEAEGEGTSRFCIAEVSGGWRAAMREPGGTSFAF